MSNIIVFLGLHFSKISSPISKFFTQNEKVSNEKVENGVPEDDNTTIIEESKEDLPPNINNGSSHPTEKPDHPIFFKAPEKSVISHFFRKDQKMSDDSISEFQSPVPVKRPKPTVSRKRTKKQSDIRKVLKINPNLVYEEEAAFSRMIAQKSIDNNMDADQVQLEMALTRSIAEQTGGEAGMSKKGLETRTIKTKRKPTNKKTQNFFELIGMQGSNKIKYSKSTLLTRRDVEHQNKIVASRVELLLEDSFLILEEGTETPDPFFLTSSYLFDMRVNNDDLRIMKMNSNESNSNLILGKYYVGKIFEISKLQSGHLLRNWRKIPGRTPSPEPLSRKSLPKEQKDEEAELELEKEIEEINKQSHAFLENFEWREKSPELFSDSFILNNSVDKNVSSMNLNGKTLKLLP